VTVLLAEANSRAETVRGQGDATRNQIFADAYGQDPDFFTFYRSMQAYERSMQHSDTHLVLRPDSNFFRYFGDPQGKWLPGGSTGPAAPGGAPSAATDPAHPSSATK
jgi:membrane protease subunit HflC